MKLLVVFAVACLTAQSLAKPDETREKKFEEARSLNTVKRMYLESINSIGPVERTRKKLALGAARSRHMGKSLVGGGTSQTIGVSDYENNKEEEWTITASANTDKLALSFTEFSLESPASCGYCYDYVQVFDGADKNARSLGKWCGTDMPNDILSSGNVLTVLFQSDCSEKAAGFSADVTVADLSALSALGSACTGGIELLTETSGVIKSPNYPGNYGDNADCRWQIELPGGQVKFEFEDLAIEWCPSQGCPWDKLVIYDGVNPSSSSLLATYCGYNLNYNSFGGETTWTTSGNTAYVVFTSDSSVAEKGFKIRYSQLGSAAPSVNEFNPVEPAPAPAPVPAPAGNSNGLPVMGQGVALETDGVDRFCLFAHNRVRQNHANTPDVVYDYDLELGAQAWAITLANEGGFYHSTSGDGENLYWSYNSNHQGTCADAVFSWYEERHNYDYSSGTTTGGTIGHFTQIVWDSTSRIGCAIATKGPETWIVARYSPPGNYVGQYTQHVKNPLPGANFPIDAIDLDDMKRK